MPDPSDAPGPTPDHPHPVLAAIQDWAQHALPAPPSGHPGPECQWCPLCQLASVLRGEHPELTERMAEAGAALANAMKALAESAAARADAPPADASAAEQAVRDDPGSSGAGSSGAGSSSAGSSSAGSDAAGPGKPQPRPRVQHIRLDDETED